VRLDPSHSRSRHIATNFIAARSAIFLLTGLLFDPVNSSLWLPPPSPFAAPNSRSRPKFDHSRLFTLLLEKTRAPLPHGRPYPHPNLKAPSPSVDLTPPPAAVTCTTSRLYPLCRRSIAHTSPRGCTPLSGAIFAKSRPFFADRFPLCPGASVAIDLLPLCFHILRNPFSRNSFHAKPPGVWCMPPSRFSRFTPPQCTSHVFSHSCGLFVALCSLFHAPIVCFQQLRESFCKIPGVWVSAFPAAALQICRRAAYTLGVPK
jgi:hypothetical protein